MGRVEKVCDEQKISTRSGGRHSGIAACQRGLLGRRRRRRRPCAPAGNDARTGRVRSRYRQPHCDRTESGVSRRVARSRSTLVTARQFHRSSGGGHRGSANFGQDRHGRRTFIRHKFAGPVGACGPRGRCPASHGGRRGDRQPGAKKNRLPGQATCSTPWSSRPPCRAAGGRCSAVQAPSGLVILPAT